MEIDGTFTAAGFDSGAASTSGFGFGGLANTPPRAGRGLVGLAPIVLLPVPIFEGVLPVESALGLGVLEGEAAVGKEGAASFGPSSRLLNAALTLRRLPPSGVKPKPPKDVLVAGFELVGLRLYSDEDLSNGLTKLPSLVPGLLFPLLPFRLRLEPGRGGGPINPPIGLSTGEKKLDLRRSRGVVGRLDSDSIVRSDNEGLEVFLCFGVAMVSGSTYSSGDAGWPSREPNREAERKLSRDASWSLFSSSSVVPEGLAAGAGCWFRLPREVGRKGAGLLVCVAGFKLREGFEARACPLRWNACAVATASFGAVCEDLKEDVEARFCRVGCLGIGLVGSDISSRLGFGAGR